MKSALRRIAVVGAIGVGSLALAGPALAHVTVHSDQSTQGASDALLSFRTPNEEDNAVTTSLDVQLPTSTPLLGVLVAAHPGWTAKVTTTKLPTPVKTDDGTITEAVSEILWTANSKADGIQPGQFADFVITAGQLPSASSVVFKALQTYSNGDVVKWIELPTPGSTQDPDHPAPTLHLSPAASDGSATATPAATTASTAAPVTTTASSKKESDGTARTLGIVGIALGAIGLGVGVSSRRRA